ncbi:catechol 2,3-dioxygenase [Pseudonocardia thermophila]|jgi:catechol 2,3 dioxygenase|uniref:Metapyrocatechase n=1 Tax=Pseudonocardia thermophila TaxID=1848 RepID=A0A1M6R6X8_PSETH|nr:catechol 2,3-dioxygenase [Pseudonocardia thermophila]SHK28098.1 catechol 2,3-dioxygenase [Pseudonocardia thermophila]
MGILRLAHVDVRTPDLDLATAYYTQVMGLQLVQRGTVEGSDAAWFKCWDEEDHHSLRLRYHPRAGLDSFTFRVESEDDLHDFEKRLEAYGAQVSRVSRGEAVGQGESIRFEVPSGQIMELVWEIEKTGNLLGKRNPAPAPPPDLPGIAPPRVDHLLVNAEEVAEACKFFTEVLGLRLTEQVLDGNGHQLGVWLAGRTNSPHDLAVVNGPNGALHHWAYWLDDWDHIRKAADILAFNGVQIDQGPTRHGVTRGNTIYFFDPLGIRNEVFTGGYWVDPDKEIITWTEQEFGKGLFYYENVVSQRFLRMHT